MRLVRIKKKEEKGSFLLNMIMFMGLMSALSAFGVSLFLNHLTTFKTLRTKSKLELLQTKVTSLIESETAWSQTLALPQNATTLQCLGNLNSPCSGSYWNATDQSQNPALMKIQLVDTEGTLFPGDVFAASSAHMGMTLDGAPCLTFDGTLGNDDCPLQIQSKWYRTCVDPQYNTNMSLCPFPDPMVTVVVDFILKTKNTTLSLNMSSYHLTLLRRGTAGTGEIELARGEIRDTSDGAISSEYITYYASPTANVVSSTLTDPANNVTTLFMKEKTYTRSFTLPSSVEEALFLVSGMAQANHPYSLGVCSTMQVFVGDTNRFETLCPGGRTNAVGSEIASSSFSCLSTFKAADFPGGKIVFNLILSHHSFTWSTWTSPNAYPPSDLTKYPVTRNISVNYVLYRVK